MRRHGKRKTLNKRGTSYGLKHVCEKDIGYITNGVFIAAAIAEEFWVKRCDWSSPNAWLNITTSAWPRPERYPNGMRYTHRAQARWLSAPREGE